jgi:hypothetical protein
MDFRVESVNPLASVPAGDQSKFWLNSITFFQAACRVEAFGDLSGSVEGDGRWSFGLVGCWSPFIMLMATEKGWFGKSLLAKSTVE